MIIISSKIDDKKEELLQINKDIKLSEQRLVEVKLLIKEELRNK